MKKWKTRQIISNPDATMMGSAYVKDKVSLAHLQSHIICCSGQ